MSKIYGKGKTSIESEEQQKLRWQVELEFVQCLANPNYLNFLAQRGYFKDQTFVNYLKYLQYWKEPEYAKYLMYPLCLYFLDLLQYEHFRREIANTQCCKYIDEQALIQWQHYARKRMKLQSTVNNVATNSNISGTTSSGPMTTGQNTNTTTTPGASGNTAGSGDGISGNITGNLTNSTDIAMSINEQNSMNSVGGNSIQTPQQNSNLPQKQQQQSQGNNE